MLYRLYIGSNNNTKELETNRIVGLVSNKFEGFTAYEALGYWQGNAERSLIVEIETLKSKLVVELARILCRELQQQAVGLARIGKLQFIGL